MILNTFCIIWLVPFYYIFSWHLDEGDDGDPLSYISLFMRGLYATHAQKLQPHVCGRTAHRNIDSGKYDSVY